jgi:hypothetical protein
MLYVALSQVKHLIDLQVLEPLSHSVLEYFQPRNVHLAEDIHLQALEHIAWCTCLHLALWENSSYNVDLQITKYILEHNLWTFMSDPHIKKTLFDVIFT